MNYIFIDTAEGTRVLLRAGDKYRYAEDLINAGAETLMPTVDRLLSESGVKLTELDAIGACVGPGSFTGLRIGLTTVKTLCYCLSKPCFAVNNLRLNDIITIAEKLYPLLTQGVTFAISRVTTAIRSSTRLSASRSTARARR